MSDIVVATARKLSVKRTGFDYDMLLKEQQDELQAEVRPVIEASGAEELLRVAELVEKAYLDGPYETFHTRLQELAGGDFSRTLGNALDKARRAA